MATVFGTAKWAYIQTPNTKFEPQWTIDVAPDSPEELEKFKAAGHRIKEADGLEYVVFKRKVHGANGRPNQQPRLVDEHKNPIDVQVGNGSKVCVQYNEYSGSGRYGPYQGLDLKAVQVLDLVEFAGADGDEFETFDPDDEF